MGWYSMPEEWAYSSSLDMTVIRDKPWQVRPCCRKTWTPPPLTPSLSPLPFPSNASNRKEHLANKHKAWASHLPQAMLLQHYNVQSMMQDGEGSSLDLLLISLQINSDKNLMTQNLWKLSLFWKKKWHLTLVTKLKNKSETPGVSCWTPSANAYTIRFLNTSWATKNLLCKLTKIKTPLHPCINV